MKPHNLTPDRIWVDARIEAYLEGELPLDEQAAFERLLAADEAAQEEVVLARRIQDGLRTLPLPVCPPGVTRAVLEAVDPRPRAAAQPRDRQPMRAGRGRVFVLLRPALTAAALVLLVVSSTWIGRPARPEAPTRAEVAQALAEAKWALGYLSEVGRETGRSVRHGVIEPHVVLPARHVLGTVLPEPSSNDND